MWVGVGSSSIISSTLEIPQAANGARRQLPGQMAWDDLQCCSTKALHPPPPPLPMGQRAGTTYTQGLCQAVELAAPTAFLAFLELSDHGKAEPGAPQQEGIEAQYTPVHDEHGHGNVGRG